MYNFSWQKLISNVCLSFDYHSILDQINDLMIEGPMFGDLEAQRHWMGLTLHRKISEWYFYNLKCKSPFLVAAWMITRPKNELIHGSINKQNKKLITNHSFNCFLKLGSRLSTINSLSFLAPGSNWSPLQSDLCYTSTSTSNVRWSHWLGWSTQWFESFLTLDSPRKWSNRSQWSSSTVSSPTTRTKPKWHLISS
jgi:hypothetical protein